MVLPVELEAYFFKILDNYDEERVYPNDIKKILQWYNLLLSKKILTPSIILSGELSPPIASIAIEIFLAIII